MNKEEALKILGLNANPSEQEIKKAYRKLALEYHPDKHSGESKDVQKQNEEKFKELGVAYNFLTGNDVKEATTFSGEDLERVSSTDDLLILLCSAIFKKQKDFLEKLLSRFKSGEGEEFGDYINEKNSTIFDNSPLYIACLLGYTDIVEVLLKYKANPDLSKDVTPLCTACSMGYTDIVILLLKHKANPDLSKDVTPLQIACLKGRAGIVEVLLKYKANPDLSKDNTPLQIACLKGRAGIVEVLLKYKANPDLSSGTNNSRPLFTITRLYMSDSDKENYIKITELLLKYGADPNTLKDNTRIIEFAEINILKRTFMLHGNNKIKKLMVQYGGVDRRYLFTYGLFATYFTSCMIIHVSSIYKLSNYEIPICIFAILFCTYRALEAAFFAKTKEPSPEFAEVITEKVVNNVGLNAEDNSKRIDNALA
ncbi:ankyrin repeat domain-containing protein [Wolbachia endosymbiont (group A) of Pogonocherus hispidulus]|uniref:ankyrin repeat domain-containing protein n=1 Tax=Wolbachia endosymbiont (group A) of Pogonocherus hispidulus TaxID=3066136 RepID=UPI00333F821E